MRTLALLAGSFTAVGVFATAATAAPLPRAQSTGLAETQAEKVHGWHRHCTWGPAHFHRHVPGAGNVPCHGGGGYYAPRRYGYGYGYAPRYYGGPSVVLRFGGPYRHYRRR